MDAAQNQQCPVPVEPARPRRGPAAASGPDRIRAVQMLLLAALFWGLSFPVMKSMFLVQQRLAPQASTWFLSALCMVLRFGISALILILWQGRRLCNLTSQELGQGLGLGLFGGTALLLQMDGLAYIPASTSAFLTQLYCVIIPIFAAVRRRRWPRLIVTLSCAMVLLGTAILARLDWGQLRLGRGETETLLGAILFSGQILWLERPAYAGNETGRASCVMFSVIAMVGLPVCWLTTAAAGDGWAACHSWSVWGFQATLILGCTLIAYLLMNHWQAHLTATEAGLIYCTEPVFASAYALFLPAWFSALGGVDYPNETLSLRLLGGGGLIVAANILLQTRPGPA